VITKRKMNDMITAMNGYTGISMQKDCTSRRKKWLLLHTTDEDLFPSELFFVADALTIRLQSHHKTTKNVNMAAAIRGMWKFTNLVWIHLE
jgi:hypothetical protein